MRERAAAAATPAHSARNKLEWVSGPVHLGPPDQAAARSGATRLQVSWQVRLGTSTQQAAPPCLPPTCHPPVHWVMGRNQRRAIIVEWCRAEPVSPSRHRRPSSRHKPYDLVSLPENGQIRRIPWRRHCVSWQAT